MPFVFPRSSRAVRKSTFLVIPALASLSVPVLLLCPGTQVQAQVQAQSQAPALRAEPKTSSQLYLERTQALVKQLTWLKTGASLDKAQLQVFQMAQKKAGQPILLPKAPANDLIRWQQSRYYPQGDNTDISAVDHKALYALVAEDLLVARELFKQNDFRQQRRALQLMFTAALMADMRIRDGDLTAGIYDAFMLPFLVVAYEEPTNGMSRTAVLQSATGIYKKVGDYYKVADNKKYRTSLQVLISLSNAAKDPQTRDWARYKLGVYYAEQSRFDEAIKLMSLVSTSGLLPGRKKLLEEWQEQKETQSIAKARAKATNTSTPTHINSR